MKVAEAECGLDELEHAKFNDSWDGMDDDEAFVSYDAQEGKSLCAVTLAITNAGDSPAEPPYSADKITLEDGPSHSRSIGDKACGRCQIRYRQRVVGHREVDAESAFEAPRRVPSKVLKLCGILCDFIDLELAELDHCAWSGA